MKLFLQPDPILTKEGCSSAPGKQVLVERALGIRVSYTAPNGEKVERRLGGLLARVVQHEVDHLDGICMVK